VPGTFKGVFLEFYAVILTRLSFRIRFYGWTSELDLWWEWARYIGGNLYQTNDQFISWSNPFVWLIHPWS
jgi:hypothetical protein